MSATATVANHVRYKDQLKLMRAETVVSWFVASFDRMIEALQIEPAVHAANDDKAAPSQRYFGAFHC
jgi:hypothetical protein